MRRTLIVDTHASSCYFRTSVGGDKALIQITERCNLHCAHCFVSSGDYGDHIRFEDIVEQAIPGLLRARVERLTLTGGEPFVHPAIMEICSAVADLGMPLAICTNATQTTDEQIARLIRLGNIHIKSASTASARRRTRSPSSRRCATRSPTKTWPARC